MKNNCGDLVGTRFDKNIGCGNGNLALCNLLQRVQGDDCGEKKKPGDSMNILIAAWEPGIMVWRGINVERSWTEK